MPKKTRKMKERAAQRRSGVVGQPAESMEPEVKVAAPSVAMAVARPILSSARPMSPQTYDYSHIYSDLKRIALFAGFFFVVLIVLSFVVK